jgi:hypothetical protein
MPTPAPAAPRVRRLVLVPAAESGRSNEAVRRFRLARRRLEGRPLGADRAAARAPRTG